MGYYRIKTEFNSSGNWVIKETVVGNDAQVHFGTNGNGVDVVFYTETADAFVMIDESADALEFTGSRVEFVSATTNTDGGIIKAGTSGGTVLTSTPDMKFMAFYLENDATSGDNRGMYLRLYLSGAGGGGEAFRAFTTVNDIAAGTAHGAHISLNFATSGSITGLGVGMRATLHIPNYALSGGTYAGAQSELYFDGDGSADISGTTVHSIHRFVVDGEAAGMATAQYVFDFAGLSSTQFETTYSDTPDRALKCLVNGTPIWIACSTATT